MRRAAGVELPLPCPVLLDGFCWSPDAVLLLYFCTCNAVCMYWLYMLSDQLTSCIMHLDTRCRGRDVRDRELRGDRWSCALRCPAASGGAYGGARILYTGNTAHGTSQSSISKHQNNRPEHSRPHRGLTAHPSIPPSLPIPPPKHPDSPAPRPAQARPSMSKQTQRNETKHPPNHPKTPSPQLTVRLAVSSAKCGDAVMSSRNPLRHFRHLHVLHR